MFCSCKVQWDVIKRFFLVIVPSIVEGHGHLDIRFLQYLEASPYGFRVTLEC